MISSGNKARLVFWRLKNPLPGHRVFSKLAKKDPRIDMEILEAKMTSLPADPMKQNAKWYSLYKRYSDSVTVKESHKNFLLARDLCSIAFLFAVSGPLGIFFFQNKVKWAALYFGLMLLHYIVLSIVAQNHGNRFVCNVIAEYTADFH